MLEILPHDLFQLCHVEQHLAQETIFLIILIPYSELQLRLLDIFLLEKKGGGQGEEEATGVSKLARLKFDSNTARLSF
jgi:hypothetical protein